MLFYSLTGLILSLFYLAIVGVAWLYSAFCSGFACGVYHFILTMPTSTYIASLLDKFSVSWGGFWDSLNVLIALFLQTIVLYIFGYFVQKFVFNTEQVLFKQAIMTASAIILIIIVAVFIYLFFA
jgi:hypothetical protein